MILIYTREELLNLAIRCAPTTATARRIRENGATILGGITSPEGLPGWIVQVWMTPDGAGHGPGAGCRLIGIWCNEPAQKYQITYPARVPAGARILKGGRL